MRVSKSCIQQSLVYLREDLAAERDPEKMRYYQNRIREREQWLRNMEGRQGPTVREIQEEDGVLL